MSPALISKVQKVAKCRHSIRNVTIRETYNVQVAWYSLKIQSDCDILKTLNFLGKNYGDWVQFTRKLIKYLIEFRS